MSAKPPTGTRLRLNVPALEGTPPARLAAPMGAPARLTAPGEDQRSRRDAQLIPDIPDEQLAEYSMGQDLSPNDAIIEIRADELWKQVAKECGILTGDPKHDQLIWEDHQLAKRDPKIQDPLAYDEKARRKFAERIVKVIGG